jgi:copper(I)-binding protein
LFEETFAMMKAVAAALIFAFALPAAAREGGLEVKQAWSRPAAAGANGVGYLTLINHGKADALIGVESPVAQKVEMHASSMAGGVMKMSREDRVPVPAGGQVSFAPNGRHLMLVGLKQALHAGDHVAATLRFASGATLKVDLPVGAGAPPHHHMEGMEGMEGMH